MEESVKKHEGDPLRRDLLCAHLTSLGVIKLKKIRNAGRM